MKPILFISDLHLCPEEPATVGLFSRFATDIASTASALYVLGDLFEYWAGDDDSDSPFNAEIISRFAHLSSQRVLLFLMHGNRDFLLGKGFADKAGFTMLDDPHSIELFGTPTLISHGDELCSDDVEYQKFRSWARNPATQKQFLQMPLEVRKTQIRQIRERSDLSKQGKTAEIMDVNQAAVAGMLRQHGYPRLIHGHTHRPARHEHQVDGRVCERWVLPDWHAGRAGYLRCDESGCEFVHLTACRP